MKRFITIALTIMAIALVPVAADESPLSVTGGAGLSWSQRYDTGIVIADVIIGLRGGVWGDAMFDLNEMVALGGELGMYYMTWEINTTDGSAKGFFGDFPVLGKARLSLGEINLSALAGGLFTMDIGGGFRFGPNALVGARLHTGSFYAEADYIIRLGGAPTGERSMYPRFALGYAVKLID